MKFNNNHTTSVKSSIGEDYCEVSSKELGDIFCMYHPMESSKSFKVDEDYRKRFEKIFGAKAK